MLSALLDAAPPGRTRPTIVEAVDLLRGGLRARLGRPASRTVVAWALLVATIWGVFSAAVATRVAWETATPLPSRAEALAIAAEALPGQRFNGFEEVDATLDDEYKLAAMRGEIVGTPVLPAPEMAEAARRNLQAHGWTVYPTTDTCAGQRCPPVSALIIVAARRGDTTLRLEMYTDVWIQPPVSVTFQQATPAAVYPAGAAGGLLGALVAFLVFGWASRRTQGNPSDGIERVMLGFALFLWWGPTVLGTTSMARHHVEESHPSWHPMWEWLGQPLLSGAFVLGCASAAVGLVVCAVGGRNSARVDVEAAR
jgi:hypothetical protein